MSYPQQADYCETHGCTDIADESHRGGDYVAEHCVHGEWIVSESPSLDTWNCHIVPIFVIAAGQFEEETQQLYEGWGRDKQSKGLHRRFVTEWEPIE